MNTGGDRRAELSDCDRLKERIRASLDAHLVAVTHVAAFRGRARAGEEKNVRTIREARACLELVLALDIAEAVLIL